MLFSFSWNITKSILSWYSSTTNSSPSMISGWWPPALYTSVALGVVLGLLSMAAAVAVVVQATLGMCIIVLWLVTLFGKSWRTVALEGRTAKKWLGLVRLFMKISIEEWLRLMGLAMKILIKEGLVALCAVLGYFALVRRSKEDVGAS
ncbi:hypothetical protein Vadar_014332 [Vaccinium darrowii]|uniref:Uncharacterized protein n=1 Tax=Vaccinium darrowii TaxID=229202 RepID=A0ACB7Z3T2_9ERIC|nr:hypothetical protein Vadar_014332 [Vaccinium darrowii]